MSSRLGVEEKDRTRAMLCPCCGGAILCDARECGCGARFVGQPLDESPLKVQRFGPVMTSVVLLGLVIAAALIATKWLAFAGLFVMWSAWRALRLAKRDPELYGGYKTAAVTFAITIVAGAGLAAYGLAHIPQALDNYKVRQIAATQAAMYHVASSLEDYKLTVGFGSYPKNAQEFKKALGASLPADYWDQSIKYESYTDKIADRSIENARVPFSNFELRSAGPDGLIGTDDDIIMRDGIFFTNVELKGQPVVRQLR